jgi:hypothetical protein
MITVGYREFQSLIKLLFPQSRMLSGAPGILLKTKKDSGHPPEADGITQEERFHENTISRLFTGEGFILY